MTKPLQQPDDDGSGLDDALAAMLSEPMVWEETNPATEDAIVAAILAEAASAEQADVVPEERSVAPKATGTAPAQASGEANGHKSTVVSLADRRRSFIAPFVAGVAAAALIVAGLGGFTNISIPGFGEDSIELALAGTDLAPDASASAEISETPQGTRILLDVSGLPPAEPGTYYEAWLRTGPDEGVSAGTFHLRGGDGEIEMWAGVTVDDYPLVTVTIQPEGLPESSGTVVLKGTVEPSE